MTDELGALFEKTISLLAVSLDKAVKLALKEYERLEQEARKGKLSSIYISFLWSSVLCKLPWLRIDLYDENDRDDITECFASWDVPCISDKLYLDVDMLAKQSDRMKDYELEQAWLNASDEYFKGFESFLPLIISQCPVNEGLGCRWHFGQYLGNTVVVREKVKDEVL